LLLTANSGRRSKPTFPLFGDKDKGEVKRSPATCAEEALQLRKQLELIKNNATQKTAAFLTQCIALPKTHIGRDKMRQFELADKPVDLSTLFRLTTSAYTCVPSIAPRVPTKELFHAVQMPDYAVYASENRLLIQNKIVSDRYYTRNRNC
jgi:hypothetical protein